MDIRKFAVASVTGCLMVTACVIGVGGAASAETEEPGTGLAGAFVMETMWAGMNQYLTAAGFAPSDLSYASYGVPSVGEPVIASTFATLGAAEAAGATYSFPGYSEVGPLVTHNEQGDAVCLEIDGTPDPYTGEVDLDFGTLIGSECDGSAAQQFKWVTKSSNGEERKALTSASTAHSDGYAPLVWNMLNGSTVVFPGARGSVMLTDNLTPDAIDAPTTASPEAPTVQDEEPSKRDGRK